MTDEQILALIGKQNELLTSLAERVGAVAPPTAAKPTTAGATAAFDLNDITAANMADPKKAQAAAQAISKALAEGRAAGQ